MCFRKTEMNIHNNQTKVRHNYYYCVIIITINALQSAHEKRVDIRLVVKMWMRDLATGVSVKLFHVRFTYSFNNIIIFILTHNASGKCAVCSI